MESTKQRRHPILKGVLIFFLLMLLALAIFFAIDYSHYARDKSPYRTLFIPRLEVALMEITALSADRTDMQAHILIHNPLPFNLRADSLQYKIFISGVEVIKSTYPKSVEIGRWDSTSFSLPVTAYNNKLLTVLSDAEKAGKDSVEYEIQTSLGTNLVVHKNFNVDIKTLQPLVYIPKISMNEIVYDSLNFKGVILYLHTTIVNKNKFPLTFKNLKFKVALANDEWVKGEKDGVINIPDTSTTELVMPLRISFKEIGKSLGPLIREGKNTPFKFQLTLQLVSTSNAIKNSLVVLNDEGAIKEIVKLAKDEKKEAAEKKKSEPEKPKQPKKKIKIEKMKHTKS
jgi:LEA14-like dessication related protein